MSERNPFEIRTRMLELAADYMQQQFLAAEDFAKASFTEMVRVGQAAQQDWQKYAPKMYDVKDIVAKAQELYGFVTKRD
jgi:hypothetical protein